MENIRTFLSNWNKGRGEKAKLQQTYAVIAITSLLVAGLASLVNDELGQYFLQITFIVVGVLFINAITWALLESFILNKLPRANSQNRRRK